MCPIFCNAVGQPCRAEPDSVVLAERAAQASELLLPVCEARELLGEAARLPVAFWDSNLKTGPPNVPLILAVLS